MSDKQQLPPFSPFREVLDRRRQQQADIARRLFGPTEGEPTGDEPEPPDAA